VKENRFRPDERRSDDISLFLALTAQLGINPETITVSCANSDGAYGGAMGPAQFLPSVWLAYADQVSNLTGHRPADPWDIEDAFVAAAAKLSRDGASSQTRAGEIAASKRYYCGNANSTSSACVNYANSVQRLAAAIEKDL